MLLKVVAYITRETERGTELLVFRHPRHIKTPIQVPQGTVEDGESVIDGLWRELEEETGRANFVLISQLAKVPFHADWRDEWQERNVFHLSAPADTPDEWTHVVTNGESDKGLCFEFFWLPLVGAKERLHWSQNQWLAMLEAKAP
jgi:8-oxo-dGTP pyrophosphatase MutT (NUDIX family)